MLLHAGCYNSAFNRMILQVMGYQKYFVDSYDRTDKRPGGGGGGGEHLYFKADIIYIQKKKKSMV